MKCIDKIRQEHPDLFLKGVVEGFKCPHMYGYAPKPVECEIGHHDVSREMCEACWNREANSNDTGFDFAKGMIEGEEMIHAFVPKKTESTTSVGAQDSPKILDSGNRREFETGAVRDIQVGKGRCDLMPLDVIATVYKACGIDDREKLDDIRLTLYNISVFQNAGDIAYLYSALACFRGFVDMETMLLEVSKHFEEGAKKYGENNWQKGIPTHCYIDSAVRHYLKYLRGDTDERHDRAFCWNIICCIWTCIHKPELNDYAKGDEE